MAVPPGLAEFFGDHMVVNGKIWPKMNVEPRNYRLRLLNGCDSRFLAIQFWIVRPGVKELPYINNQLSLDYGTVDTTNAMSLRFTVIGSDQGLASSPTTGRYFVDRDRFTL